MNTKKVLLILSMGVFICGFALIDQPDQKLSESIKRGQVLYNGYCAGCHKADGTGYPNHRLKTPPLAHADYLLDTKEKPIEALVFGLDGKIIVNGEEYDRSMPAVDWTDEEISDVLNYARNSWGNKGEYISEKEVQKIRKRD
ncbi:MAG: cytochrome c [Balneolaceae bacterium]|nr:cytochrome c [Balneolaceae bacterium]MBO6547828.1 cytochrome c [Balneolaceae bacterium]MBO6648339.1 cytochrome c [Balneolaceae bacterium]